MVASARVEGEAIDTLEIGDALKSFFSERTFPIKGV
jgi:hypothetical protein